MQDEAAESATSSSDDFWVLAAALKRFVGNEGCGSLPLEASQRWRLLAAACLQHALTASGCIPMCVEVPVCAI
jgi:hypothetical protein